MLKNQRLLLKTAVTAMILVLAGSGMVYAGGSEDKNDFDGVTINAAADVVQGKAQITGTNETGKDIKILVKKEGIINKWYEVNGKESFDGEINLNDGEGAYRIYAMIHKEGFKYAYGPSVTVENIMIPLNQVKKAERVDTADSIYVKPSKDINSNDNDIEELSRELTAGKETSREKIEAIYGWIVTNLTYDYDKLNKMLKKDFSDNFGDKSALESRKGVCYDYATLFAALCRASGIEAKVDKGYSSNIIGYHAWNEVYDSEKAEWLIIDATIDSIKYHKTGNMTEMKVRTQDEYSKTSEM